ncbi:unnamed protein product [Spirodela intermedia]|uniref:Uncharacterized protein n=1 Tax=Spirodela intermedia TaxID=51605 RepID=A0A7I8I969_SPIIN|nr:unnamed protein product [Spirodela intermedia]CAA6654160.1 unnamed protein product [Spirodela intermedia]
MTIGEMILGAIFQAILTDLRHLILSSSAEAPDLEKDLRSLQRSLTRIQSILEDVEKNQVNKKEQKPWVFEFRDVQYEANDVLDEIRMECLRRRTVRLHKVRDTVSWMNPNRLHFEKNIKVRLRQMIEDIDKIPTRNAFRPAEALPDRRAGDQDDAKPTTGNVSSESALFGREAEIETIVKLLTSDGKPSYNDPGVITIQGVGGIGKTAVAQAVYNRKDVSKNFFLQMWVYVPRHVAITKLTRSILEAAGGSSNLSELHMLQEQLKELLAGKKYLLVLDNLWNEKSEDWEELVSNWDELKKIFLAGAPGSRILVTTRSPTTTRITRTIGPSILLRGLSFDDSLSVFLHHAFENPVEYRKEPELAIAGMEITAKCSGSPLAAKTLGSRLRGEDRSTWEHFRKSGMLHLKESCYGIFRSLESTYHQLPPHQKRCFRFCGLFPKSHVFDKDTFIRLWMAQGYIFPKEISAGNERRVEDVGAEYFDSFVDRLFFEPIEGCSTKYKMSGLISELAQLLTEGECSMIHHDMMSSVQETIRHSALILDHLHSSTSLEGLIYTSGASRSPEICWQLPQNMAQKLKRLRVLDFGNIEIESLDASIGQLIHLRYLGITSSSIKGLPDSVSNLYNLQTLCLRNCKRLKTLPKDLSYLTGLRHLDLHDDADFDDEVSFSLCSMPKNIYKLKLQTLSKFVVGGKRKDCRISELKKLTQIRGDLRILDLHNIHHVDEVKEEILSDKEFLSRLELQWGGNPSSGELSSLHEHVLRKLKPHTNLQELWIVGYNRALFPEWVGHASFSKLVKVRLSKCRTCVQLPPLGRLELLEELWLKDMDGVEYVDCQFCCGSNQRIGFPSLRKLSFESMPKLKGWYGEERCKLPSLQELYIKDCPLLLCCHSISDRTKVSFI